MNNSSIVFIYNINKQNWHKILIIYIIKAKLCLQLRSLTYKHIIKAANIWYNIRYTIHFSCKLNIKK